MERAVSISEGSVGSDRLGSSRPEDGAHQGTFKGRGVLQVVDSDRLHVSVQAGREAGRRVSAAGESSSLRSRIASLIKFFRRLLTPMAAARATQPARQPRETAQPAGQSPTPPRASPAPDTPPIGLPTRAGTPTRIWQFPSGSESTDVSAGESRTLSRASPAPDARRNSRSTCEAMPERRRSWSSGANHTPRLTVLAGDRSELDDPEFLRRVDRDILRAVELLTRAKQGSLNPEEAKEALFLVGSKNLNVSEKSLRLAREYAECSKRFDSQQSSVEGEFGRLELSTTQASMKQDLEKLQAQVEAGLDAARYDTMDLAESQLLALAGLHLLTAIKGRLAQRYEHLGQIADDCESADLVREPAREAQGHAHASRVVGTWSTKPEPQTHRDGEPDPWPHWLPQPALKGVRERCTSSQASPFFPYMLKQVDQQLKAAVDLFELSRPAPLVPHQLFELFLLIGGNDRSVEPELLEGLQKFVSLGEGIDARIEQTKQLLSNCAAVSESHHLKPDKIVLLLETLGSFADSLKQKVASPCNEILQRHDLSPEARTLFQALQYRFDVRIDELNQLAQTRRVTGGELESRALLADVPISGTGNLNDPAPVLLSGESSEGESAPEPPASEELQSPAPAIVVNSAVGSSSLQLDSGVATEIETEPVPADRISPIPDPVDVRVSRENKPSPPNAPPPVGRFDQKVQRALELHGRCAAWFPGSPDRRALDSHLGFCEEKLKILREEATYNLELEAVVQEGKASPELKDLVHRLRLRFGERATRIQSLIKSVDRDAYLPRFRATSGIGEVTASSPTTHWQLASPVEQDAEWAVHLLERSMKEQLHDDEWQELRRMVGDSSEDVRQKALHRLEPLVDVGKGTDLQILALEESLNKLSRTSLSDAEWSELVALVGPNPYALGPEASGHLLNCLELGTQFDQAIARVEELKSGPAPLQSIDEFELNSRIDQSRNLAERALNQPLRALETPEQMDALPGEVRILVQGLHQEFDARISRLAHLYRAPCKGFIPQRVRIPPGNCRSSR